ncbi:MAG: dihydropteroate synthase [Actinomycetota bacterium]|nr:dihydropteroate synthase [Actinomycetota bacterium]
MSPAQLRVRERTLSWTRPLLMGVVNANPDSFSDPGPRTVEAVVARAVQVVAEGAAMVDVGGQSAITGRPPADAGAEASAVVPVVEAVLDACPGVPVSVDTFKPDVAAAALAAGAHLINDVSGLRDRALARHCAAYGAGLVVMHTAAPPLIRLQDPRRYEPGRVADEVAAFLRNRVAVALEEGLAPESVVVDPGVDFTKTPSQTIELLRDLQPIVALGHPVLLALSRKDFVGALTRRPPSGRLAGTLGAVAGVHQVPGLILRVHDVAAVRDVLLVLDALTGHDPLDRDLVLPDELRHEPG